MHRALDGEVTPEEREHLDALLTADTAARRMFDEMSAVAALIDDVRLVDPPGDLTFRILTALPEAGASRRVPATSTVAELIRRAARSARASLQGWAENWGLDGRAFSRPALIIAYAFSVGLVTGVGLYAFVAPSAEHESVAGTLAPDAAHVVDVDGFEGSFHVRSTGELFYLGLAYDAELPTEIVLFFDGLDLRGFSREDDGAVSVEERFVTITADRASRYDFSMRRAFDVPGRVRVEVLRDGEMLHEGVIQAP